MQFFIWIIILLFVWILLMPSHVEGLKKINLKKTITKTANKVGGSIAKISTTGMDSNTKMVLKNLGKIKPAIKSFISK